MITVYKRLEGCNRIVFYSIFILYGICCVISLIVNVMDLKIGSSEIWWKTWCAAFSLFQLLFAVCFGIVTITGSRIKVDETLGEIVLGSNLTNFGVTKILISNITTI